MMLDTYHRKHTYLRISLTDVCNLRCFYCMPDESYDFMPMKHLMQPPEIEMIAKVFVELGVTKIRLTGGEPLARRDFDDIVLRLSALPVELTLTTNATLLHQHVGALQLAGIRNLNISLDTLSPERFQQLTRRDKFSLTMRNIRMAIDRGFQVKINMVVMKGVNVDEVLDFVAWTKDEPIDVRFIEFMPFAGNRWTGEQVFAKQDIMDLITARYAAIPLHQDPHATSQPYAIPGHRGTFAVISTMSAPFCAGCNRMRLTADGKMKNCLFSKTESDLLSAVRGGKPLEHLIRENILGKAEKLGGQFGDVPFENIIGDQLVNRSMISIGG
ncbi:GTP 3',8-cyclase MoaA [Parapedobacter koreensis]|uniref:GTP 3',8-cyclase n=1 Tax=Parapedobacter koreensis TaxID=332977 RepID=A0A1H7MQ88_9SPHI|nr:GTP 3',8-cyclase MoaA [Parapedobacter koreensis]SEL13281.1 cyclic pyranopterin monophosphate synthase subunit MoaA [Parapedobacter koreensis]